MIVTAGILSLMTGLLLWNLIWPAQPCVLPGNRSELEISSKADVRAPTVTEFQRLVFALWHGDRQRHSNSGVVLQRLEILNTIETSSTANPEIAVQRCPQPLLEVITKVTLERCNWSLRLRISADKESIARKIVRVPSEQPNSAVPVQQPIAPTARVAKFWFESPPIDTEIDQLCWIVLTSWRNHAEA